MFRKIVVWFLAREAFWWLKARVANASEIQVPKWRAFYAEFLRQTDGFSVRGWKNYTHAISVKISAIATGCIANRDNTLSVIGTNKGPMALMGPDSIKLLDWMEKLTDKMIASNFMVAIYAVILTKQIQDSYESGGYAVISPARELIEFLVNEDYAIYAVRYE